MKKISVLFKTNDDFRAINEVRSGNEWALTEGIATEKFDGTACMVKDGILYVRYDTRLGCLNATKDEPVKYKCRKRAKPVPDNAILCQDQPDPITGSFPVWIPASTNIDTYKHQIRAFENSGGTNLADGTYEAIGPQFQGNPYNLTENKLVKHGSVILEDVPRTFEGIKQYLNDHCIEGIVFHRDNGDMCKIRRIDFGYVWNHSDEKVRH